MKLIQYAIPEIPQPLVGMNPPVIIRSFQGVNTFDPYSIAPSFFTDMSNMTTDDYPAVSVRPGYTQIGATIGTKVLGLGAWKDTQLHAVFNDGTWRYWNGTTWTTIMSGLSTTADASFVNFQGNQADICLFMANGVNGLKKWDGATAVAFGNAPSDINVITSYKNRLWGASNKELHASALDQPDEWQTFAGNEEDSYAKDIEAPLGENINMLSGSLTKLTIGTPNSVWELYGALPSDFNTVLLTDDEGFVNNKSATTQEGIMKFIHQVGIFEYAGGTIPNKSFSDVVKRYITSIDSDTVAGSDGNRIYFRTEANRILMYDPRVGVNAWNVWDGIDATQFTLMDHDFYIGDSTGRVMRLGGTTDNGTPISWSVTTKPFTGASMNQKSRWIKAWETADMAAGSTLAISLSNTADEEDFVNVKSITATGDISDRVSIPLTGFQLERMVRIRISGIGWSRLHEIAYQNRTLPLY